MTIPAFGKTYKVLTTAPFPYSDKGQTLMQGVTFVADNSTVSNAWIAKGIALGHIVEIYAGTTFAAQEPLYLVAKTDVSEFLKQYGSGNNVIENAVANAALLAELQTELLVDITLAMTAAPAVGGTTAAGTSANADTATVSLFQNGSLAKTAVIAGGGAWSMTGLTAAVGADVWIAKIVEAGVVVATAATRTTVFTAPVVTGPILNLAVTVSGTLTAANGTAITVYKAGTTQIGTTTVTANAWSATVTAVATADSITAKAGSGASLSVASNTVVV